MAYNPVNPNGQAPGANSAPVVLASDTPIILDDLLAVLNEIQVAVTALASLRGTIADLRVSIQNTPSLGGLNTFGVLGHSLNAAPANLTNQTSQQAFILNVARS